jgi:hypothetical protein
MQIDLSDYIGDYVGSEYYALLDPGLKPHAEGLLSQVLHGARQMAPNFPVQADAELFGKVLLEKVAPLDMSLDARQGVPRLLAAFFDYLAVSGKCPQAYEWAEWMPAIEAEFNERFRGDGSVRGETVRKTLADVGRNDPCPCGSGNKFKKCCIDLLS